MTMPSSKVKSLALTNELSEEAEDSQTYRLVRENRLVVAEGGWWGRDGVRV